MELLFENKDIVILSHDDRTFVIGQSTIKSLSTYVDGEQIAFYFTDNVEYKVLKGSLYSTHIENWVKGNTYLDENFMIKVQGRSFSCECGANVFRKSLNGKKYKCNGCGETYEGEK